MQVKKINLNGIEIDNVFLAPLAGYTDYAFRSICLSMGASLTFTEMVSAKGLFYKNQGTAELLFTAKNEDIKAAQIFGEDPLIMRKACESEELKPFNIIDINMGCPVPKVFKNGEGSALLLDIKRAQAIVKECKKSNKIITVKCRIGVNGNIVIEDFAKAMEDAGADLITVHGRLREDYYSGEVNFNEILKVKKSVKIPVIANGGIFCKEDADKMIENTGADGVMIARGALGNPKIFADITGKDIPSRFLTGGVYDVKKVIKEHLNLLKEKFEDNYIAVNFRKVMPNYLKGVKNSKELKREFFAAESVKEIEELLDKAF